MEGAGSFEEKAAAALEIGRTYLDADNAHLARVDTATDHWEIVVSTDPDDGQFPVGMNQDLSTTYCRKVVESEASVELYDATEQGWADDVAYREHQLECYYGIPLFIGEDRYGTVCFVGEDRRTDPFGDAETMFAELIARHLERELERQEYEEELTRRANLSTVLNRVLRHNIRNDVCVIRGRVKHLLDRTDNNQHGQVALNKIDQLVELSEKARELERLVGEELDRQQADVAALIEGIVDRTKTAHPDASITVECPGTVAAPLFPSFERAIEELLENAVKHSGATPSVTIEIAYTPNALDVRVEDDGPGLSDRECAVVETGVETPLVHGSGLGLWLVHWIIASHGGTIEATADETGTTMAVSVPRASEPSSESLTELKQTRDRYRAAFDEAFDGMVLIDDDTNILDANPAAADIYGCDRQALLGRSLSEFSIEGFDFETTPREFRIAGSDRDIETVVGDDGIERSVEYSTTVDIVSGQHLVVLRDVSERIEREHELHETNQRLEAVVGSLPNPIIAVDTTGVVQLWNNAAADIFGYSVSEAVGTPLPALELHPGDEQTDIQRVLDGETFTGHRIERVTRDGNPVRLRLSTVPLRDETGEITGVMAIGTDVKVG